MTEMDTPVDPGAVRSYLETELGTPETFDVEPLSGGNANETVAIRWDGREFVLRRPPEVQTAPELLHDLEREYTALEALSDTPVPTPEVVAVCEDASVIGDVFYVMERLEGEIVDSDLPERFAAPEHRRAIGAETIDTLSTLHNIDANRVGLGSFGDPADYAARQVEMLTEQLEWAQERTAASRELPVCFEVAEWLEANAPETTHHTLVHGDYKPDNLMFAPGTPPTVAGVLDWEMATRGDPFADLGWLLSYWVEERDPSPITDEIRETYGDHEYVPLLEVFVDEYMAFMTGPEFHSRRELLERYEAETGLEYPREHDRFYRTLGIFKLAALCEGFYRTFLEDPSNAKDSYPLMELAVPTLGRQAKLLLEGEIPL